MSDQQLAMFQDPTPDPWDELHVKRGNNLSWSKAWVAMSDEEQRAVWNVIWHRGDPDYEALRRVKHTIRGRRCRRNKGNIDPLLTFVAKCEEGTRDDNDSWQNWLTWRVIDPFA